RRASPNRGPGWSGGSPPSPPPLRERAVEDAARIARSRPRVVFARKRRDHRDAVGARCDRLAGIAGVDSGNAAHGKLGRPAAKDADDARQSAWTDRRARNTRLRGGQKPPDAATIEH